MRKMLLLTAATALLWIESTPAQMIQSALRLRSPNVDSLRRVLKLSPDLRLDWIKGTNGVDTFRVVDDFNRSSIGPNWDASGYWQIHNGELGLTAEADREWRYLAAFLPVYNTPQRRIYSVSYRWGKNADALGIREGAMALMLDQPSTQGTGYWLWHRYASVWLWVIKNGTWEYTPGEGKQVDRQDGISTGIRAGDVVTGYVRRQSDAVYFDYYLNKDFDATVKDVTKEFPKDETWYTGVFLHGQRLNNNIDDFTITWLEGSVVTPVSVTDLHAVDSTASSIQLEWTSTGDRGLYAHANRLELRYSPSPINLANFAKATLVPNLPAPAPSGVKQNVNVTGLNIHTTYYFALKIFDGNGYAGSLSNLAKTRTSGDGIPKTLAMISGCDQSSEVNGILPMPLVAWLTDSYGDGVKNSPVQFVVLNGKGAVDGKDNITVNTDAKGEARATWQLGPVAGIQKVEIRANSLGASPNVCTATAKAAPPSKLAAISGNGQIVSIGKTATRPLVARLTDKYDNPYASNTVVFNITSGGGFFLAGGKVFSTLTDSSGQASGPVVVSEIYGDTTKITARWTSSTDTTKLAANFFVVAAWPDSVAAIKGNNQTAMIGKVLPESLVVKILDAAGGAAKSYPITFRVLTGGGTLANNQTQIDIATDSSGYARTTWTLGALVGEQQVEVKALFNGTNLHNTPFIFKAKAVGTTAVNEKAAVPLQFALHQNFPNPLRSAATFPALGGRNSETMISFDLPEAGQVEMNLYDINGRRVRQLLTAFMPAGRHRLLWNGQDDSGWPAHSGVYFLVLRAHLGKASNEVQAMKKIILMK
jgi:hypothetical protein